MGSRQTQKKSKHGTTVSGFTLVELLVVIGIIAVLLALLVSVIRKARKQAVQTQCMSQLRQLGASLICYASENEGYLPPPYLTDSWILGNRTVWPIYMDAKLHALLRSYGHTDASLTCPTAPWETALLVDKVNFYKVGYGIVTGYQKHGMPSGLPASGCDSAASRISEPNKVMAIDMNFRRTNWNASVSRLNSSHYDRLSTPDGGHSVFADGHVRWFRYDEMGPTSPGQGMNSTTGNYAYGTDRWTFWGITP